MTYAFYLYLKKEGMDTSDFQIVQYDYSDKIYTNINLNWINNQEGNPASSSHFSWIYNGIESDSEGKVKGQFLVFDRTVLYGLNSRFDLIPEFCNKALSFDCRWNPTFNRQDANEVLLREFGFVI